MTDSPRPDQIDFIRLDGHAVRVTSWTAGDRPGSFRLVTITRGTRDVELLDSLLAQGHLQLDIEGQPPVTVSAGEIERRTFGEGQTGITRFAVLRSASDDVPPPADRRPAPSLEERVARLEGEIAELRALVQGLSRSGPDS